jgi:Holliday junction resolvasome RuvABC DNA-binding subunit
MFRALLSFSGVAAQTALGILRAEISRYLKILMYIVIKA